MNRVHQLIAGVSRRRSLVATISIVAVGIALAAAYFPALFNKFIGYDDEGYLLVSIRNFLEHGKLYEDTFTQYGPFYYLVTTPIFWLSGKQPTLDIGRLIVLVLTSASAGLFAAAVWRVTKSLPWALLCEVGTYLLLISKHGDEPMHPGSLVALLLAVLAFSLSSYSVSRRNGAMVFVGAAAGALLMTKINVGLLAIGALVLAFAVGNRVLGRRVQYLVVTFAVLGPFVLVFKNLDQAWGVALALMVSIAVLELGVVSLVADTVSLPRRGVAAAAVGLFGVVLVSAALPLSTGTSLGALVDGLIVQPLRLADVASIASTLSFDWDVIVLTLVVIVFVVFSREHLAKTPQDPERFSWPHALLATIALWLFGMGIAGFGGFGAWLLPIALLPAVAVTAGAQPELRLALRLLVPLAILQVLHAYPVPGAQTAWGTVVMAVPCAIAIAIGSEQLKPWTDASRLMRGLVVAILGLVLMTAMNLWPVDGWKRYLDNPSLGLAGASLLRVDETQSRELQGITETLRENCDTLWFYPAGLGSYYIFTGLEPPTGLFTTLWPALLSREQKQRVVRSLSAAEAADERVCILRTNSVGLFGDAADGTDPLVNFVGAYTVPIAEFDNHTILRRPDDKRTSP